jgi:hypothetical protein
MYTVKEYHPDMDLTSFYEEARKRKRYNNDSYESMIKPFEGIDNVKILILFYSGVPVGVSMAEPFLDGFRIFVRLCVFNHLVPKRRSGTVEAFKKHQHITARFFLPEHAKLNAPLYLTTHPSATAKMQSVHSRATKWFSEIGVIEYYTTREVRGSQQIVWKVNADKWLRQMEEQPIYYENLK